MQIRVARKGKDTKGFGTGYLVAPRLVLTADHVLDGLDGDGGPGAVTVCQPDTSKQEYPATVRWQWRDTDVDAALVEIDADCRWPVPESLSDLVARPPQRYGRLIGTRPHPVALTGFPRLQKDPEQGRLDEKLDGHIAPGTGALAGRYEITSTTPTPEGPAGGGTRWSGMSGAAVLADDGFGGDLLCGIVRHDRQADGGTRLTATPISHLLSNQQGQPSAFCRLIAEHTGWDPVLEPIEPARLLKPATVDRDLDSPAALLRADTEAVAFHGRDKELADLHAWCTTGPAKAAIRVITGPGGQGKTRLARRLTDTLSREDWVTAHLRSDLADHDTPPDLTPLTTALPLLLVVDYAETRPRLLRRLVTHLHTTRHRVRLLLLARCDGEWRTDTLSATPPVRRLLAAAPVIPLGPLRAADRPDQGRNKDFRNAARDLACLLPRVPNHDWTALAGLIRPADDLSHPRYANALTLQMTALVTLLQHGPRPVTADPGASAEEILLEHEGRFWKDSADADAFELGLDTATLKAAVAVAALCGADTADAATRVLAALPEVPAYKTKRTAAWLAHLYPADPDRYWGTLQPDRIAEYHATRTLAQGRVDLPALLAGAAPDQQAQTVTVLARAAIAHHSADRPNDTNHVLRALGEALDAVPLSYQAARIASAALPYPSGIVTPLAVRLAAAVAHTARQGADELDLAFALFILGARLFEAERLAEAMTVTEQAVDLYRRLAASDPTAHEPDLARSLFVLGTRLFNAGRLPEALTVTGQTVDLYRRLAAANPTAHEPDLAGSLLDLGARLSESGRLTEAVTATEQAVDLYRRLAAADPAAYEPDLASALFTLGTRLSESGRLTEELIVTKQAVGLYRWLAAADPAAHEPDLAFALFTLGIRLFDAGRVTEAVTATEQAVDLYRRLAATDPATHEPNLGRQLRALGTQLFNAGQLTEAMTVTEQAVDLYRRLAAANPATHEPNLATSLLDLSTRLFDAGRLPEAMTVTEQAVDLYRRLAATDPATHEPNLATSLTAWAMLLALGGDLSEALSATGDAVECYQAHIAAMPSLLPLLHSALELQADLLEWLERPQDAAAVRRWLKENPLPPDSAD
ncbi:tetratricopeptide repeat protein [Streptomyces sp. NPDC127077]|uniref:tetratricopeptide repeat protein n=1 Tax=Streptomyces sp. NPDC127077 TaxID=3347131 RepID=UPI003656E2F3